MARTIFVVAIIIAFAAAAKYGFKYTFGTRHNKYHCEAGKGTANFRKVAIVVVTYDSKTRQIKTRHEDAVDVPMDGAVWGPSKMIQADLDGREIGLFWAFMRKDDSRRNENPVSNVMIRNVLGKYLTEPAQGSDVGSMYYQYPIVPFFEMIIFPDANEQADQKSIQFKTYEALCNKTNAWIANEGFYKFETRLKEWIPIYYDPTFTDFYY
ncbi:unnamed protein product [Heligmosomoides polygyrus]|uniref:Effector protein n=1 Tax=Heligmosomoides polygyrus TaxID=6339 RepID=A0A183G7Q5_HELPZ|nr:unnamed protein product [Heligmosomoides polygyrus]